MPFKDGLHWSIATAFGAGCIRPAPGTWGSVAGALALVPLVIWMPLEWLHITLAGMVIIATILGRWSCPWATEYFKRGDPSQVVIDEVAGVWLTAAIIFFIPLGFIRTAPLAAILVAFCWFRCFDILKPWPISLFEKIAGPWGIMADDLVAAIPAAFLSILTLWLIV